MTSKAILGKRRHPEVCADTMTVLALIYRVPVEKRARSATLLGGEAVPERFGPLKAVLGAILAHYANREVRLVSPAPSSPSVNAFSGNSYCDQQD